MIDTPERVVLPGQPDFLTAIDGKFSWAARSDSSFRGLTYIHKDSTATYLKLLQPIWNEDYPNNGRAEWGYDNHKIMELIRLNDNSSYTVILHREALDSVDLDEPTVLVESGPVAYQMLPNGQVLIEGVPMAGDEFHDRLMRIMRTIEHGQPVNYDYEPARDDVEIDLREEVDVTQLIR